MDGWEEDMRLFGRGGLLHPTLNIARYRSLIPKESVGKVVLNIGSGGHRLAPHIINLDLFKGDTVDVVGDAHLLPLANESVDFVLLLAVLEHVQDPGRVISESFRVLREGGIVYCEFPFIQPLHGAPADYWRATPEGLRYLFKDFKEIDIGVCTGPGSAVSWLLLEYSRIFLARVLPLVTRVLVSPLKYMDRLLLKKGNSINVPSARVASAYYFLGRKETDFLTRNHEKSRGTARLDIGCGRNKREGFTGIDINRKSGADIIASALRLPIKDSTISEINCSHLVEHLCPDEAQELFDELYRVLEDGGKVGIKVDRDWTKKKLLRKDPEHKHRYSVKEIEGMVEKFTYKRLERRIYRFGYRLRNKIFGELGK